MAETEAWFARTQRIVEPLTLDLAVRRALSDNLDHAVLKIEHAIQAETETAAILRTLPSLQTQAEYRWLSELRIAESQSADTGVVSLEPSFSSERDQKTAYFEVAFSLLDFGISFFRARQEENEHNILEERVRRSAQNLVLDVTEAYYRVFVAQQAVEGSRMLRDRLQARRETIRQQIEQGRITDLEGLQADEAFALVQIRIQDFESELYKAKAELTTLMGLAPGSDFVLAPIDLEATPPRRTFDVKSLENEALHGRPELWEQDLKGLIATDEVRARIVNLFPNPTGFFGGETDQNEFLRHQGWWYAGARLSWDLLSIPRKAFELREALATEDLVAEQATLVAMGVLTQLRLAILGYEDAAVHYELAANLDQVRQRILSSSEKHAGSGQLDEGSVLSAEADALFARLRRLNAWVELLMAEKRIENAVGRDAPGMPRNAPLPPPVEYSRAEQSENWQK